MKSKFKGVMLGLAVGDALGAPVEFMDIHEICHKYGPEGIKGYAEVPARYTDDTQMSLATAWGLLDSSEGPENYEQVNSSVYERYQEWYKTQATEPSKRRAPGGTCLNALSVGIAGSVVRPINDSKGCGGVMRVAPAGLFYPPGRAFTAGLDFAAMTHTHPTGYLPAGYLAELISNLVRGEDLRSAMRLAHGCMVFYDREGSRETANILLQAVNLPRGHIGALGQGWVAEEALAIALYAVLQEPEDFLRAVLMAVNITGDSDSTGSIAGAIAGAIHRDTGIPLDLITGLEDNRDICRTAEELYERRIV